MLTAKSALLLPRILDTPQLARAVPRLPAEVLHRVVLGCGLEACGNLLALATPAQLSAIVDVDLWRSEHPGRDELLDTDRFGAWLEVMGDVDASVAARVIAGLEPALAVAGLAAYVAVFDPAAVAMSPELDGASSEGSAVDHRLRRAVGGYLVVARRNDAWDAVLNTLVALADEHLSCFHRVMRGCRRLSSSAPEVDGLDDLPSGVEQLRLDLADARERRRERQGYVTPAQARAFLQAARGTDRRRPSPPRPSPVATAHLRGDGGAEDVAGDGEDGQAPGQADPVETERPAAEVFALVDLLVETGVVTDPARLLPGVSAPDGRFASLRERMRFVQDHDSNAHARRGRELGFLANVLVAGCSLQARAFTTDEAADAAAAVCNLGLDAWPAQWPTPTDAFLVDGDLTTLFQVGWAVLHDEVCLFSAHQLLGTLDALVCRDRDIQASLDDLRRTLAEQLVAGTPWQARDAIDALASLDLPAWAAVLGLVAECPVLLQNVTAAGGPAPRTVDPLVFAFVSERSQIAQVAAFLRGLPDTLSR